MKTCNCEWRLISLRHNRILSLHSNRIRERASERVKNAWHNNDSTCFVDDLSLTVSPQKQEVFLAVDRMIGRVTYHRFRSCRFSNLKIMFRNLVWAHLHYFDGDDYFRFRNQSLVSTHRLCRYENTLCVSVRLSLVGSDSLIRSNADYAIDETVNIFEFFFFRALFKWNIYAFMWPQTGAIDLIWISFASHGKKERIGRLLHIAIFKYFIINFFSHSISWVEIS